MDSVRNVSQCCPTIFLNYYESASVDTFPLIQMPQMQSQLLGFGVGGAFNCVRISCQFFENDLDVFVNRDTDGTFSLNKCFGHFKSLVDSGARKSNGLIDFSFQTDHFYRALL